MKISNKGKYYGNLNSEKLFNGILLTQYDYHEDSTPWHYHENPYFMYVLKGNMMDCNKKVKSLCPAGSLMFNNWHEAHYGSKHSTQASGFHLEFERKWLKENGIPHSIWEGSQQIENPTMHLLFAKLYHEFIISDQYSDVSVEVLLLQICEVLSNLKTYNVQKNPNWVEKLKELLHFDNSTLSLDYLSNELNVHPVHISRAASKHLSMSLGEYIRQHKVKKAIPLLLSSKNSLTEIAYETGFSDQSHFNRVFKSIFNSSPNAYRKNVSKNL